MQNQNSNTIERGPVVAIMGHIDHGKSTLLSYIRKSNEPLNEAGGITQHISAYEVEYVSKEGKKYGITFVDTPGHEAFNGIRKRGASVADVVVLVVSAEDGVKPQTMEALSSIKNSNTPFIIAINKIDKPEANVEKTKQSLAENGVYVEGYGGDIPSVALSAKSGEGVPELLDMIALVAEMESLTGDQTVPASGMVIESNMDIKKGISATCIIKNGTIEKGMYITSGLATAPVRIMENYLGKQLDKASFSSPIKIIGWDELPLVGDTFVSHKNREDAREKIEKEKSVRLLCHGDSQNSPDDSTPSTNSISIIVKADTGSSLEALISEIKKLKTERMSANVICCGIGTISENDVRQAGGKEKAIVIGFNVKIDSPAKNLAERNETEIKTFEIIYKMNEWLKEALETRTPKIKVAESLGTVKVLKIFSKVKDKQILGARVEKGEISLGSQVKIIRRDESIGEGRVRELQQQKVATKEVTKGEFGTMIVSDTEIAPGDYIESFVITEK
ncbi:MAG: translation initiation factor IF-2 [Candidatus Zambryskibacteria bacterium RIFOXYD1_FULL_40_13]|nr:MAG: Translation initiation factor IF-2 protein [Parcubacteria group bacterium GW2011_GWC1_39_12]KKR19556.1 MAG: Translation initiation factor IF-2 protein [Parcubacteria group bacterium GW2011_GWF1_39_37]KKR35709.1 MAG: Translation initiation factor IF-2 protein [Parcubacteria group bacterium GW2011_GWC2_40_10]KKR52524.1 MAG: Translation initiation factor IF-2 protein [Parcubacteria group bacterium GW2011_GWE1_40_20]KKR64809.1 MAG: Translation initiation factor IF-2 protein [Parcubacteria g